MREEPKALLMYHDIRVSLDDTLNDGLFEFAKI